MVIPSDGEHRFSNRKEVRDEIAKRAATPADEPKPKTLVQKLCEVMAAVERVAKRGRNEFHKYDYVTEADLADAIRKELASRHLFIFPNVTKVVRSPLEVETTKWVNNQPIQVVRKTQLTEIEVEWTFADGESGEEKTIVVHGVGEDNVDKGFYKAFTGSEKYMLMKAFLIPTGDDPEQDSKEDAKSAKERGKVAAKAVGEQKVAEMRANAQETTSQDARRIVFIKIMPNSDIAVNGYLADNKVCDFLRDVDAKKKPSKLGNGSYYQFAPEFLADFKTLCERMEIEIA
jgi:hypothetical protein